MAANIVDNQNRVIDTINAEIKYEASRELQMVLNIVNDWFDNCDIQAGNGKIKSINEHTICIFANATDQMLKFVFELDARPNITAYMNDDLLTVTKNKIKDLKVMPTARVLFTDKKHSMVPIIRVAAANWNDLASGEKNAELVILPDRDVEAIRDFAAAFIYCNDDGFPGKLFKVHAAIKHEYAYQQPLLSVLIDVNKVVSNTPINETYKKYCDFFKQTGALMNGQSAPIIGYNFYTLYLSIDTSEAVTAAKIDTAPTIKMKAARTIGTVGSTGVISGREFAGEPLVSCKISDLINDLTAIQSAKGDVDVVFWDQHEMVLMNTNIFQLVKGKLFIGGLHVNGKEFRHVPEWE